MRQRPDARELLRLADAMLGGAPMPADPKARSYEQRLAAKARTIADYDAAHGEADMAEEIAGLSALYDAATVQEAGPDDETRIATLNRRLADAIRAGAWDEAPEALRNLLHAQVRARIRRTNPKYLKMRLEA
jgi:hypothetical protein